MACANSGTNAIPAETWSLPGFFFLANKMPDYEKLVDIGSAGLTWEIDGTEAILGADLGNAYYAAAIVGEVAGIHRFTLTWNNSHRDAALIQGKTYNGSNVGSVVSRPLYFRQFFLRRVAAGNDPFWVTMPDYPTVGSRTSVLCRLSEPLKISQQQDSKNPLLYRYQLKFQQIRGAAAQS